MYHISTISTVKSIDMSSKNLPGFKKLYSKIPILNNCIIKEKMNHHTR